MQDKSYSYHDTSDGKNVTISLMGFNEEFAAWLQNEMSMRNWSQGDLARAAGISRDSVNRAVNLKSPPGPAVLKAIACALKIPETLVFSKAGIFTEPDNSTITYEIYKKISALSKTEQQSLLDYVNFLLTKK